MQQTLRSHKCYSNREISNILGVKKTTVDHWFRTDDCFSIPDENIWFELKDLLKIETNEPKVAVNIFKINNIRVVDVKKDSVSIASDKEKIGQIVEMLNLRKNFTPQTTASRARGSGWRKMYFLRFINAQFAGRKICTKTDTLVCQNTARIAERR